jgi:hypothetical protein
MNKDGRVNGKHLPSMIEMKRPTKSKGGLPRVTPEEMDQIQRRVLDTVKHALPAARGVLLGTGRWTNQQVKLFQIMLNKVMPDLSHSQVDVNRHDKDPNKLTRAELEEIIRRGDKASKEEEVDTVDAVYEEIPDVTPEEAVSTFLDIEKAPR